MFTQMILWETESHLTWPDAFATVGGAFAFVALLWIILR